MALTESKRKSNQRYLDKLEEIKLRVPKGEKEILSAHAASQGESLNAFIRRAMAETMERDKKE